jgi:DeoR/GlpR family transcriptional regulator of sugar metabolism
MRNPLADPFVLGVSGGAALGASIALAFGLGTVSELSSLSAVGDVSARSLFAFAGAIGSTLFVFAQALTIKKDITVFTNGLNSAQLLDEYGITTYVLGGHVRHNSNAIVGSWAMRGLKEIRVDMAVLGTSGFAGRSGPCVENFIEAELKEAMIAAGNRVIVLGDSGKSRSQAVVEVALWDEIDELITDAGIDADELNKIKTKTTVTVVKEGMQ